MKEVGLNGLIKGRADMRKSSTAILKDQQEILKIRHYVMNLIYRNSNASVPVESSRALENRFGVPRALVRKALEKLIQEGYLETRRGIGTFTCPMTWNRFSELLPVPPLIGILMGDGNNFFHRENEWALYTALGNAALKLGAVHKVVLSGISEEAIVKEIVESHINALLWARRTVPDAIASGLKEAGIPLVLIGGSHPEADSVESDFSDAAATVAEELIREKRRILLSLVQEDWIEEEIRAVGESLRRKKIAFDETNLTGGTAEICAWFENNPPPDLIAVHGTDLIAARRLLQRYGLEARCRILLLEHYPAPPPDFQGICLFRDIEAMTAAGADLLKKRFLDKERPREHQLIKAKTNLLK